MTLGFRMRGLHEQSSGLGMWVARLKSQKEEIVGGSSKKKEEERQKHRWLEETQESASIGFRYPEGPGNAGESSDQQ